MAGLPVFGQSDSAPKGIVNEPAVREAVRNAMQKALRVPTVVPVPNLPPFRLPVRAVINLPPVMCAVPLTEVPVRGDLDQGILRPDSAISRDPKMPVAPGVPPCADIQNR